MGVPPAKLHEKPPSVGQAILPADSLSAGPAACKAACFFDSVGMGLRPAKFHEKPRGAGPRPALMGLAAVATWQVGDLPHERPMFSSWRSRIFNGLACFFEPVNLATSAIISTACQGAVGPGGTSFRFRGIRTGHAPEPVV